MKAFLFALVAFLGISAFLSDANAYVCARGWRGAACAGHRGAVAVGHPYRHRYGYGYRRW
jgi:hypothetical protein